MAWKRRVDKQLETSDDNKNLGTVSNSKNRRGNGNHWWWIEFGFVIIIVVSIVIPAILIIGNDGESYDGQFVGSKYSNVYHYPWCEWAQKIKPENQIWFNTTADAQAHGYRPCLVCNPPDEAPGFGLLSLLVAIIIASVIFTILKIKKYFRGG